MAHDPDRTPIPIEIEKLQGFAIAELGTPRHPLRGAHAALVRRAVSMFAVGVSIGAPIGAAFALLKQDAPRFPHPPLRSAIAAQAEASPSPVSLGSAPTCSETEIFPEQLIELDAVPMGPPAPVGATAPVVAARVAHVRTPVVAPSSRSFLDPAIAIAAVHRADVGRPYCGGDARGPADVAVTFAPSGHATHAVVEQGRALGNESGSCIAARLAKLSVPPFDGAPTTVRTRLMLR